jgi:hypothetical protein
MWRIYSNSDPHRVRDQVFSSSVRFLWHGTGKLVDDTNIHSSSSCNISIKMFNPLPFEKNYGSYYASYLWLLGFLKFCPPPYINSVFLRVRSNLTCQYTTTLFIQKNGPGHIRFCTKLLSLLVLNTAMGLYRIFSKWPV